MCLFLFPLHFLISLHPSFLKNPLRRRGEGTNEETRDIRFPHKNKIKTKGKINFRKVLLRTFRGENEVRKDGDFFKKSRKFDPRAFFFASSLPKKSGKGSYVRLYEKKFAGTKEENGEVFCLYIQLF